MSDVGAVAMLVNTVASWFMSEGGFNEFRKRAQLRAKRDEAKRALREHRWDDLRRLTAELERLSTQA